MRDRPGSPSTRKLSCNTITRCNNTCSINSSSKCRVAGGGGRHHPEPWAEDACAEDAEEGEEDAMVDFENFFAVAPCARQQAQKGATCKRKCKDVVARMFDTDPIIRNHFS
jgi:hypothetical protein